jgi:putative ABC transport system permease protein
MSIRPRWKKVFSDLRDNKLRSLLVVASIAVGVFSVGMIAGSYAIISNDMSISYASANPANIRIWTDPFDDDLVNAINNLPGVKQAEGRQIVNVRARDVGEKWISLDLVGVSDFEEQQINLLIPSQGALVPSDREVLLERKVMDHLNIYVGEELEVQLPDGTRKLLPVTGFALDQSTSAGDFLAAPLGYVDMETLEWMGQSNSFNRLYVTLLENPNDEAVIRETSIRVSDKLEASGRQVYRTMISKTNEHPMGATVEAILGVLGLLGVLIVFLSSSLIANTLNALLNQHLHYIGVMKLIGARRVSIFGMYITLILAYGLIALLIAIPLGGQAAYALSELIADTMNFELLGYRIIPQAILLQAVISIAVPLIAGFLPVNSGSRVKVQKAISGDTQIDAGNEPGILERIGGRLHWISRPTLISLRNTFRRKGRLLLTLITLTMGGAIFIAVFNVQASLESYVSQIGNYFLADVSMNFDHPYRINEIEALARQVPGVHRVEGWAFQSAEALTADGRVADNLQILAPPAGSTLIDPLLVEGRWLQPGDRRSLAVSEDVWESFPDLKPGDSLKLNIGGRHEDWTVVGIFKFIGMDAIFGYATFEYISQQLNMANQSFSFRVVADQHGLAYQQELSSRLDRHFRDLGFRVNNVEAGLATLQTASEGLDILITFLLIMALLTALVGSIGLTGMMGINVLERTREIGVMRAIGAVDRQVIVTVVTEGLIIGIISWFFAALLSFPISAALSRIISQAIFNSPIDIVFTINGFLIWLSVVIVLSILASILPARNAVRLTIREVLAYE